MSWRDSLPRVTLADGRSVIGASFRGVPFFVETSDRTGGRRTVTHEFPLRDDPVIDDLGRQARTFTVEGYVLGKNYVTERDALLAVLEDESGPGELVHPYHGTRRAICTAFTVRETIADGGMARFGITFAEVPPGIVAPVVTPVLDADVKAAADAAQASIEAELDQSYDVDGEPAFALESLVADLDAIAEKQGEALSGVAEDTQELARLDADIQSIRSQTTTLIRQPVGALNALGHVIGNLAETTANAPQAIIHSLLDTYDIRAPAPAQGFTATRERERANQAALGAALRRFVIVEAARRLPAVGFETVDDAMASRSAVIDRLDEQIASAGDIAYPALVALRSALLRAVPGDDLARIVRVIRAVAVPSLLLTYQIYGSIARERAVVARNRPQHPGFLSGEIEVLSV